MTSPDDNDPVRSELEYAPPWGREQAAREQGTREPAPREQGRREQAAREQTAREPAPREQMTRDQFRAALRQSAGAAVEQRTRSNSESRSFGDDRSWHQRALEPELVPEPPSGASKCCGWAPSAPLPRWSPPLSCSCSARNKSLTR